MKTDAPGITLTLPAAPAELYQAWVAFVVRTEQAIRHGRSLRARASEQGLVYGPAAEIVHRVLYSPVAEQARAAGDGDVEPELEAPIADLVIVHSYLRRWGSWLVIDRIADEVGIPFPPPTVAALRKAVLDAIGDVLHQETGRAASG